MTVLALLALPSFVACSSGPESLPPIGATDADGGTSMPGQPPPQSDRDGGASQGAPPLPPAPAPKAEDITEATAIFVAKHGDATNPGTRKSPLGSIAAALEKAKTDKKARVFVCEGTYEESLELENGISIVGGLDCAGDSWKLTEKHSLLASPTSPAIHAVKIDKATRVDNFDVRSPDATGSSGSSIGVLAVDSNALTFAKGTIAAGAATKGDDGVEGLQLYAGYGFAGTGSAAAAASGPQSTHSAGGIGAAVICNDPEGGGFSRQYGGVGGSSGVYYRYTADASWTVSSSPSTPGGGQPGGLAGTNGTSAGAGAIADTGYLPANGTAGTSGQAGASGRGGAGRSPSSTQSGWWLGRSGPGGGAGGCPGLAGTEGKGGGASLGVVAMRSPLRFEDMTVTSAAGGAGGKGTIGSRPTDGIVGGDDGNGVSLFLANSTGGGRGGEAGISGNGAGGHSVPIAYQGGAPIVTRTTTTPGAGGAGVEARSANGKTIPASPAGIAEGVKEL